MTPIEVLVRCFGAAMLGADGCQVRLIQGTVTLVVEIHVTSSAAKGTLVGAKGETITALRHLVHRIAKRATPPLTTWVEVIAPEEA